MPSEELLGSAPGSVVRSIESARTASDRRDGYEVSERTSARRIQVYIHRAARLERAIARANQRGALLLVTAGGLFVVLVIVLGGRLAA